MTRTDRQCRVLVAAHGHPAITRGGGEIAAWRLYEGLSARIDWSAWFMGCAREAAGRPGSVITQPFSSREFLYASDSFDWFKFANRDARFPREFTAVLNDTAPDILHFHHYANIGVEAFLHAKRALPHSRIVLTLHEFQAICNHYGQMVTRGALGLCYEATARDCNRCFPDTSRADFFLRREYQLRFFELVDQFIAPSHFVAERYLKWGLPEAKMAVLENVTAPAQPDEAAAIAVVPGVLRVGFFGQISLLKGIQVLLAAARMLEDDGVLEIQFDIHGDYSGQPEEFRNDIRDRLEKIGKNVRYHGAYDNQRVDALMRTVDVVVVPSIWWENSPVVIQECLRNRKPVICSNIGGMAEKVRPGKDGFHFQVGSAAALSAVLRMLAKSPEMIADVERKMRTPAAADVTVAEHIALYERLLESDASNNLEVAEGR